MSDLISRSALIKRIKQEPTDGMFIHEIMEAIDELPTVEAKPVVHGEWVHSFGDEWKCSECGDVIYTEGSWDKPKAKFCEECGADMRKKVDNGNFTENGKEL